MKRRNLLTGIGLSVIGGGLVLRAETDGRLASHVFRLSGIYGPGAVFFSAQRSF